MIRVALLGAEYAFSGDVAPINAPTFSGALYVFLREMQYQIKLAKLMN